MSTNYAFLALILSLTTLSFAAGQGAVDFYAAGSGADWSREYTVGEAYSVKRVSSPTRSGDAALRMETRYGDAENDYHTEMEKVDAGFPGQSAWYGFSTYVPTSWVDSEDTTLTTQWWSHSRAGPPLGIGIEGEEWIVFQRWDEGDRGLSKRTTGAVRKGEWTDWIVQAHWSDSEDGYLKVWRNGEVVYERSGPSIYYETESLRFKIGLYVWPWKNDAPAPRRSSPRVIYHDEVRIGGETSSYDAVNPGD